MAATEEQTAERETASRASRVILVTGASRGIGRAITERFLEAGHRVAATYRSGDVPEGALPVHCEITDPESVEQAFATVEAELGPVEVLVANAGATRDTLLLRMSETDFSDVVETNLTASFRLAKRASKSMMRARFGRMIFLSSVVGQLGSAGQVNYAASKSGLVGMARSITRELGSRGITANVVAPGFVETDMTAALSETQVADYRSRIPVGRLGASAEVAAVVEFLAGEDAGYVSGAIVPVDGGLGMGH